MGELSKNDAEKKRDKYASIIVKIQEKVREDFDEMDFQNAVQKNTMGGYVEDLQRELAKLIVALNDISFS